MLDLTVSMEELKELEAKYASLVKGQSIGENIIGEMGYGEDLEEIRAEISIREERMGKCPDVYEMNEDEKRTRITALRKLVKEMHLKEYHQERKMESLENYIETIEPSKKETKDKIYNIMQQIKDDTITKDELLDKLQDLVFTI
jgi:chaperonin cofactor prefoldin